MGSIFWTLPKCGILQQFPLGACWRILCRDIESDFTFNCPTNLGFCQGFKALLRDVSWCVWGIFIISVVQHICYHMLPLYPLWQLSQVRHPTAVLIGSSSPLRSQRCSFDGEVPGKKSTGSPGDVFYSKPNLVPKKQPQMLLSCTQLNTEYTKCNFGNFESCTWLCRAAVSLLWVISSPQITESFTIWLINPHKIKWR